MNSNSSYENNTKPYIIKSVLFLSLIIILGIINNSKLNINKQNFVCLYDLGTKISHNFADYLNKEVKFRNTMIIVSSLSIDCIALTIFFIWAVWGSSWQFFISIIKFYGCRMFIQFSYHMPYLEPYTFFYPGFPSLVVSYLKTNDFFYSGHVGMPLISGFEFRRHGITWMFYFCIFASVYQAIVLVSTRGHYGIDIIFGWIFSLYFIKLTGIYIEKIDKSVISIDENYVMEKKIEKNENAFTTCEIRQNI
jgi:hypothetical protein